MGEGRQVDEKMIAAMHACIDHARALLDSARAVQAANHPNIAYSRSNFLRPGWLGVRNRV
jgi:hypothetical protein